MKIGRLFRAYGLYLIVQQLLIYYALSRRDVEQTLAYQINEAPQGMQFESRREADDYTVNHTIEDGIERVVYTPKEKRHETLILMVHGMWHAAWCWEDWQALLAEHGWETHAFSLPGHGGSLKQRPVSEATLDYYLSFLKREVQRFETKPVLMGHSMGGALIQWYLKYVGDDLPAAVMVAPWTSHSTLADGGLRLLKGDPIGVLLSTFTWNATPWVRTPYWAAKKLITPGAKIKPVDLYNRLDGESLRVLMQHNPPYWTPPTEVQTPLYILAGGADAVVSVQGLRSTAAYYGADITVIEHEGHNLMMEPSYAETAEQIHTWLTNKGIA